MRAMRRRLLAKRPDGCAPPVAAAVGDRRGSPCAQAVARQLLEAVAYMHELGLVHTDLKPENILLAEQAHVKLPPVGHATCVAGRRRRLQQ